MWHRVTPTSAPISSSSHSSTSSTSAPSNTSCLVCNSSAQPSARCAHSLDFCHMTRRIFLFGGWNGSRMLNDLHIFVPESQLWARPVTTGEMPTNRAGHGSTSICNDNRIFIFGGGNGYQYLNDMFSLQTDTFEWRKVYVAGTTPAARSRHTLTYLPSNKLIVIGGGDDSRVYNDVHLLQLDTMSWSRPEPKGSPFIARWGHTTTLVGGKFLYVFGGHDGSRMLNDLSILDTDTMTWSTPFLHGAVPSPRAGHTCTLINDKLIFFGGGDGSGNNTSRMFNDLYVLDYHTMTFTKPNIASPPTGRCAHAACCWEGKLFVMGGGEGNRRFKDVHILDPSQLFDIPELGGVKKLPRGVCKKSSPSSSSVVQPQTSPKKSEEKDMSLWLQEIGMKAYLDIFIKEDLDMTTIPYLTEIQLEKIGVSCLGHRIKILNAINQMNSSNKDKGKTTPNDLKAEFSSSIEQINATMKSLTTALEHVSLNLRILQMSQLPLVQQHGDSHNKRPPSPPPPPRNLHRNSHIQVSPSNFTRNVNGHQSTPALHDQSTNGSYRKLGSPP